MNMSHKFIKKKSKKKKKRLNKRKYLFKLNKTKISKKKIIRVF